MAAGMVPASAQVTLQVLSYHGLPGLHHSALSRFLVAEMARAGLAEWRFVPPWGAGIAADRVEWSFKLNPYAGGGVRHFVHSAYAEDEAGERRPVTIEARLYRKGQYQTLVETQGAVRGDPDDSDLIAAVLAATRNLLGPYGAYHAIDIGQHRGYR
jgi:hypothetical protein